MPPEITPQGGRDIFSDSEIRIKDEPHKRTPLKIKHELDDEED